MRKIITTVLTVATLALPIVDASAATKAAKKKIVVTKKFAGSVASVDRWGNLQVTIVVRKTTTTVNGKKKVTRKLTGLSVPTYPNHTDRSVYINQNALPILKSEALQRQSANINLVAGATDTSYAFAQSLQAAILKSEAVQRQSANINLVSGATDTSYAFAQSLQAAILKAKQA